MALDKWVTGDTITEADFNKRTIRRGTTAEINSEPDGNCNIGDLFYDTTIAKPKFITVVNPRAYIELSPVGLQSMWISAEACYPAITDGCSELQHDETTTNKINRRYMNFSGGTPATNEIAQFSWTPSPVWDETTTIACTPYWTAVAGAGTVEFEFSAVAFGNDDGMDGTAFGTAQASSDTFIAADDLHIGPQTSGITIAGSPVNGDMIYIKILRDQATDTKAEDAGFLGFLLQFTIDKASD